LEATIVASVEIKGVSKSFSGRDQVTALADFDLKVRDGELVAILGPSGCGKSTLLRCVAGLERPSEGEIVIGGTVVSSRERWVPPERRGLGMVFQSYALWPHMTVFENLAFPMKMRGQRRQEIRSSVLSSLETVGLAGKENRLPSQLSGGQQQRVALARAIISNPKLLLFDEPLSNLDVNLREAMRIELRELKQRLVWTGLYVTHDRAEAVHLADRIVILCDGVIQQIGTGAELYSQPANLFVAQFMGDINLIPAGSALFDKRRGEIPAPARSDRDDGTVAIRPEWIRLEPAATSEPLERAWRGRIRLATDLGWYVEYVVDIDGLELKARGSSGTGLREDNEVDMCPDLRRALYFPEQQSLSQGES
jgi:iron(III) transport system ATP-binding protein